MKQISSVGFEFGTDQALHHTIEKVFKPVNTAWGCPQLGGKPCLRIENERYKSESSAY